MAAITGHIVLDPVIRNKPGCGIPARSAGSSARASTTQGERRRNPDKTTHIRKRRRSRIGLPLHSRQFQDLRNM
jgi:hypothetical protein